MGAKAAIRIAIPLHRFGTAPAAMLVRVGDPGFDTVTDTADGKGRNTAATYINTGDTHLRDYRDTVNLQPVLLLRAGAIGLSGCDEHGKPNSEKSRPSQIRPVSSKDAKRIKAFPINRSA